MSAFSRKSTIKFFAIFFVMAVFLFLQNGVQAAITATQVSAVGSKTDASTQTVTSFQPLANTLYLLWTIQTIASAPVQTPTVSCANGLTMTQEKTVTFNTIATPVRRITLFRGMRTSDGTNNTCTITWNQTSTGGGYSLVSFTGVDTSGTNGSGAVAQSVTGATDGASTTGLSITLAALQSGSTTAGGFSNTLNTIDSLTQGNGYTAGTSFNFNQPNTSARAEWNTTGNTTVNMTQSGVSDIGGIAVEVKQLPVVPTATLNASPNPVTYNTASTLTWSSTDATGCTAGGAWSGAKGTSGNESTGNLTASQTYTLYCTGPGGTSSTQSVTVTVGAAPTTTLGTDTDPGAGIIIAPGAVAQDVDKFTLQTNTGTETISSVTVNLSDSTGIGRLAITTDTPSELGFTTTPVTGSNTINVSGMSAGTSMATFRVRITPLSHTDPAMPAPPGGTYSITAPVTGWAGTGGYTHTGNDAVPNALTIDNLSPSATTGANANPGDAQMTVSWTNPGGDFSNIVILRDTAAIGSGSTPVEGTSPSVGSSCGGTACQVRYISTGTSFIDTGLNNGTTYYYRFFPKDTNGNYTALASTQQVSAAPAAPTITVTGYTNGTEAGLNYAGACTGCGARIGGGASFRQTVTITGTNLGTVTAGNRGAASNNIKVGTHQIADANVTVWTPTTITFLTDSAVAGDADSDWGTNFGGASALVVTAGSQTATGLNFYVFPQITSVTQPSGFPADSAREYDAGDTDGVVTLNGTRFGGSQGSGSVTTVSQTASPTSWTNTAITVQVPTAIVDTTNTGAISMAQGTGSNGKTHTYANTFRVLPRITSFSPTSGNEGMAVTVNGNHFCQSGTCPGLFSSANKVTFASGIVATTFTSWSATAIATAVPTNAVTGNIVVTSNTSYTSNGKSFTVTANTTTLGDSSDPSPAPLAPGGAATMADAFTFVTNGVSDPITSVVVGLATGTAEGLSLVEITNSGGETVYGSVSSPASDTPSIPLSGLTATTVSTIYKIRITPRIHTAMSPPPGSTYLVTAKINSWSGNNATAGSDTAGTTVTIDNLSPAGTTNASATSGENAQSTVSWTNPSGDFQKVIIYCKTANITETPTEGTDPSADVTACDGTARVKYSGGASPQSFTGLANGTTYYFRIFARDLNGNFTAIASTEQVSATPSLTPITTLGNFVTAEPTDSPIAPGATGSVDSFSLQTNTGSDTVTGATVTLASGMGQYIQTVAITNNDGSHTYCSSSPSGDTATLTTCGILVNTTNTQFKVKITASVSMPAPPGGSYAVTGRVTAFTSTNTQSLNDSGSATVTIDNASPNGATLVSGSAGNASATLNWTTSNSSDFNTASGSVVLRWAAYSAGSEVPAESSTYSAGNTIGGTATVACVISSSLSTALSKIDGTGGSVGCTTSPLTNGQAYTYKVFQKDLSGNYDTGVLMGTFQPALSTFLMTAGAGAGGTISPTGTTTVAQGGSITYTITPNLGYDVATVTDNGFTQATTTSYTINGVAMDHTVAVTFIMVTPTYTITSTAGANGAISPLGTTVFLQGASQTYTITPISGFVVDTLIVDGSPKATSTSYTFTNIRANGTIDATFAAIPPPPGSFNITASAGANGTVSPNGVTAVVQGNSQAYTVTPNSGYNIATLIIDGSPLAATSTAYTFFNVTAPHTISATFVAISGATAAVTPDTGASRPTTVIFSGKAFPGGKISVINKTLNTEKLTGQENVAGDDGSFSISFVGILQGLQSFGLIAKDKDQRTAQTKFFFVDTTSESFTTKNILVPPTIDIANGQVSRGGNATIFGYAAPGYSIRLYLDDILMEEISVEQGGLYKFEVPTGALEFGQHKVKTKQVSPLEKKESDFSTTRTFIVSRLSVVKADLSGDGKVDIRDWSIFLSRWGAKGSLGRESIDFNGDGKVDIADFSIFIKTIRKK